MFKSIRNILDWLARMEGVSSFFTMLAANAALSKWITPRLTWFKNQDWGFPEYFVISLPLVIVFALGWYLFELARGQRLKSANPNAQSTLNESNPQKGQRDHLVIETTLKIGSESNVEHYNNRQDFDASISYIALTDVYDVPYNYILHISFGYDQKAELLNIDIIDLTTGEKQSTNRTFKGLGYSAMVQNIQPTRLQRIRAIAHIRYT